VTTAKSRARRPPVVGYVTKGSPEFYPGTAHVRLIRRLQSLSNLVQFERLVPSQLADTSRFQSVVVLRDALSAGQAQTLRSSVERAGTRLVVELDDDLISADAVQALAEADYEISRLRALRSLVAAADMVIVSTDHLVEATRRREHSVTVIPNGLDPDLWARPVIASPPKRDQRILYMGTYTHERDLKLLREPLRHLQTLFPTTLDVIGVSDSDEDWYNRVEVPVDAREYPAFVMWLREHSTRWTIGVAPLLDEPFNRSKSDLKALEYAMLGLPTVASRTLPYLALESKGATLTPDGAESWVEALSGLLESPATRQNRTTALVRHVLDKRLLDHPDIEGRWIRAVLGRS
jgi:glycosyltransferase involved in cell wall biosynthesis